MKMTISQPGLDELKGSEALRLVAYHCSAGVLTIGWGHTGPDVTPGLVITRERAYQLLAADAGEAMAAVNRLVQKPLNQNQFDALVSFAFNAGVGALGQSTLLKVVNQDPGNRDPVAIASITDKPELRAYLLKQGVTTAGQIEYNFLKWIWHTNPETKKKEISNGLFNRRRREAALYFTPVN